MIGNETINTTNNPILLKMQLKITTAITQNRTDNNGKHSMKASTSCCVVVTAVWILTVKETMEKTIEND